MDNDTGSVTFMLLLTHVMLLQYAICLYGKWLNALSQSEVMAACLRVLESICTSTVFAFVFVYFIFSLSYLYMLGEWI
jgi:hypothetical protein